MNNAKACASSAPAGVIGPVGAGAAGAAVFPAGGDCSCEEAAKTQTSAALAAIPNATPAINGFDFLIMNERLPKREMCGIALLPRRTTRMPTYEIFSNAHRLRWQLRMSQLRQALLE